MCRKYVSKHVSCTCQKHASSCKRRPKFPTQCNCWLTFSIGYFASHVMSRKYTSFNIFLALVATNNCWSIQSKASHNIIIFCSHVTAIQLWTNTLQHMEYNNWRCRQELKVYVVLYKPNIALFPGHSHLQFLIVCSTQKQRHTASDSGSRNGLNEATTQTCFCGSTVPSQCNNFSTPLHAVSRGIS